MKGKFALLSTLAMLSVGAIAADAADAQLSPTYSPPDYYVGAGIRAGFNDNTSFVLDSKAKITDLGGRTTLSVRPEVVFDSNTELRLPISVDYVLDQALYPYAGAGVAYNADGRSTIDPMITAGLDWGITRNVVVDLNGSVLFKPGDTDTEFTATINYAF